MNTKKKRTPKNIKLIDVVNKINKWNIPIVVDDSNVTRERNKEIGPVYFDPDNGGATAKIHIVDYTINDFKSYFRQDEYIYNVTKDMIDEVLTGDYHVAFALACFVFLHEVGHWIQFQEDGQDLSVYSKRDDECRKAYKIQENKIDQLMDSYRKNGYNSLDYYKLLPKISELQKQKREIPMEKEADQFAKQHLVEAMALCRKIR